LFSQVGPSTVTGSPLERLDSRIKLISALVIIMVLTLIQQITLILFIDTLLLLAVILSRIGVRRYLRAIGKAVPFALILLLPMIFAKPGIIIWEFPAPFGHLSVTQEGLLWAALVGLRFWGAATICVAVVATTSWQKMLWAMRQLGLPDLILEIIQFTGRYASLLVEELGTMRRAQRNRGLVMARNLWDRNSVRSIGQLLGTLAIRSYDRSERVYRAMLARGYTGEISASEEKGFSMRQAIQTSLVVLFGLTLLLIDKIY